MARVVNPFSEYHRERNLLIPGRKPVGSVKVDWSHPLARGLRFATICTNRNAVDLVSGQMADSVEAAVEMRAEKNGLFVTGGNVRWTTLPTKMVGTWDEITVVCRYYIHDGSSAEMVKHEKLGAKLFVINCSSNWFSYGVLGVSAVSINTYTSPYGWGTVAFCNSTGRGEVHSAVNGEMLTDRSSAVSSYTTAASDDIFIYPGVGSEAVGLLYVFKRMFSDEELQRLSKDPYAFLIPA